jgi:two-component system C4-dicarboxylate transport sensor histidine kinase DctB
MPDRPTPPRRLAWLLALLASAGVIALVYVLAARWAEADVLARGQRQLQLMAPELESALEKFDTLPYALGFQENVARALAQPHEGARIAAVNAMFQAIERQSKVGAIYLMDRTGHTIAASNWDRPLTFVGKNFGFRPYFRAALAGATGRFYGIGNTTSEPGYFLAQPVRVGEAIVGVIAVKILLDEFERTWRGSDDTIVLADRAAVVFLSNRADWKYRSLHPLSAQTQAELASTLQYGQLPVVALKGAAAPFAARQVGRLGWELRLYPAAQRVTRTATMWALAAALLLASGFVAAWAVHQRRRRLDEQRAASVALQRAARELDEQLVERTALLREANRDLAAKYTRLEQTEQALRATQDELVQAGKLAMLGQMAAGVTHELNQPLAAIRAFADNAVTFLERGQPDKASANLGHIGDASARMGAIIGQLKGFARRSGPVALIDVAQSIRASAFLLDSEFRRLGAVLTVVDARDAQAPALVAGDPVRIEQVFINLLRNALDAVEAAPLRTVTVTLDQHAGHARVRIVDSGPGIPGEVAAQLFAPFFTTKPSGKGLGLGLAISSSIVQAMNGMLSASNGAAGGAEFTVSLPLAGTGH